MTIPGSLWVDGVTLRIIGEDGYQYYYEGVVINTAPSTSLIGSVWVESNSLMYIDLYRNIRQIQTEAPIGAASGRKSGSLWIVGNKIHWIASDGTEKRGHADISHADIAYSAGSAYSDHSNSTSPTAYSDHSNSTPSVQFSDHSNSTSPTDYVDHSNSIDAVPFSDSHSNGSFVAISTSYTSVGGFYIFHSNSHGDVTGTGSYSHVDTHSDSTPSSTSYNPPTAGYSDHYDTTSSTPATPGYANHANTPATTGYANYSNTPASSGYSNYSNVPGTTGYANYSNIAAAPSVPHSDVPHSNMPIQA